MLTLSIDTSCEKSSLAIHEDDKVIATRSHLSQKLQTGFFTLMEDVLTSNKIRPSDINRVICGIGPGSFTGVRIGVCFAKTFCQLTSADLIPIRSYYLCLNDYMPGEYYLAVTPSTHSENYASLFMINEDGGLVSLRDVDDGNPARVIDWLKEIPSGRKVIIYGEGIPMLAGLDFPSGLNIGFSTVEESLPEAKNGISFLRTFPDMGKASDPMELVPLYVRPSPAETQWLEKNSETNE